MARNNDGELAPGLTDFGLSAPSDSNSVGEDNPALQEMADILKQLKSPAARALGLQGQVEALRGQESPDFLQSLLRGGLLPALAGGAAAALGQPAVGAGLALGGLSAADVLHKEQVATQRQAIVETEAQLDDSLEDVAKLRGTMANLVNTNPNIFVDPETGESAISPETLGLLVTGVEGVELFPTSRDTAARRDAQWQELYDLKLEAWQSAPTPESRRTMARSLANHLEWPATDAELEAMSAVETDEEFQKIAFRTISDGAEPQSFLDAMIFAIDNRLQPMDSQVLSRIRFLAPDEKLSPANRKTAAGLDQMQKLIDWQTANPDIVASIASEGLSPAATQTKIIGAAFEGDPAGKAQLESAFVSLREAGIERREAIALARDMISKVSAISMQVDDSILANQGITREQFEANLGERMMKSINAMENIGNAATQNSIVIMKADARRAFREAGLAPSNERLDAIYKQALKDANKDAAGRPRPASIEKNYRAIVDRLIEKSKK